MESYGRQQRVRVPPTTPSSRAHQRYSSQDTLPYPDYYRNRTPQGTNTRFSLPSPGSYPLPQSLPPQHTRRQSAAVAAQPHYATPTRPRQHHASNGHQGRIMQADPEQWESLRSKGYVLKGSGDQQQRTSVTFAPSLATVPSQISSSSSSYASTVTSSPQRRPNTPTFQVHPSLRTGYHPGADVGQNRPPHNQFMKRPLEAAQPHRQPVSVPTSSLQPIRYDPVDAALVIRQAPPAQQAITFHASSFTPDPIYRAQYLAQPAPSRQGTPQERQQQQPQSPHQYLRQFWHEQPQQHWQQYQVPIQCQPAARASRPQPVSSPAKHHFRAVRPATPPQANPISPTYQIFSRPASPEAEKMPIPGGISGGCMRSSTLRRQETDQSSYSQLTLPEPYLPAVRGVQDQQPSPLVLADWQPLSVDPVRSRSQDVRSLWLDLERALMGSPSVDSSRTTTAAGIETKATSSADDDDETTYDFTETGAQDNWAANVAEEKADLKTSLTRPRLVRTDRSEDRLERNRRALASSIIEKAQNIAASLNAPLQIASSAELQSKESNIAKTPSKHVRISTQEEVIDTCNSTKAAAARPSKIPKLTTSIKHASRIPVPTKCSGASSVPSSAISRHVAWEQG